MIKDLKENERPREKALRFGIEHLSDIELLALLIGFGGKNNSALDIAYALLKESNGLSNLFSYDYASLRKIKGINKVKAINILAIRELMQRIEHLKLPNKAHIISAKDIYNMYRLKYIDASNEEVLLILLNNLNQIVKEEVIALGSLNDVGLDIRLIFHKILKNNCHKFIIIHNHPTGEVKPSKSDLFFTSEIKKKSEELSLKLLDHIIIGKNNYFSFKDHALI